MQRRDSVVFSVIVPVENRQLQLSDCIKSVVEQPGPPDWECILVDAASRDASPSICDALAAECSGVRVIHRSQPGLAAAWGAGMAAAAGQWLLFLAPDSRWQPDMLPRLRRTLALHPGFDWYAAGCTAPDLPPVLLSPGDAGAPEDPRRNDRLFALTGGRVQCCCLSRDLVQQSGAAFWPGAVWGGETAFCLLALRRCRRLYIADFVMTRLPADPTPLPRRLAGILGAVRGFAQLFAEGDCLPAERNEILNRLADLFWTQAAAAARAPRDQRRACLPLIRQCRVLYRYGRPPLPGWLLNRLGPRLVLRAAARRRR